jgi:hypothetical protein
MPAGFKSQGDFEKGVEGTIQLIKSLKQVSRCILKEHCATFLSPPPPPPGAIHRLPMPIKLESRAHGTQICLGCSRSVEIPTR